MSDGNYIKKYNTADAKKCEYIQAMTKVYIKPPTIVDGKCTGYRTRYTKALSTICQQCSNLFKEG